mmetsp:Transcript_28235/g.82604  ORF Transcript_28235/g.82604 Transcript_28235/m.82604 type:complete len:399 (-) Transcript_28235:204-1400(-)
MIENSTLPRPRWGRHRRDSPPSRNEDAGCDFGHRKNKMEGVASSLLDPAVYQYREDEEEDGQGRDQGRERAREALGQQEQEASLPIPPPRSKGTASPLPPTPTGPAQEDQSARDLAETSGRLSSQGRRVRQLSIQGPPRRVPCDQSCFPFAEPRLLFRGETPTRPPQDTLEVETAAEAVPQARSTCQGDLGTAAPTAAVEAKVHEDGSPLRAVRLETNMSPSPNTSRLGPVRRVPTPNKSSSRPRAARVPCPVEPRVSSKTPEFSAWGVSPVHKSSLDTATCGSPSASPTPKPSPSSVIDTPPKSVTRRRSPVKPSLDHGPFRTPTKQPKSVRRSPNATPKNKAKKADPVRLYHELQGNRRRDKLLAKERAREKAEWADVSRDRQPPAAPTSQRRSWR